MEREKLPPTLLNSEIAVSEKKEQNLFTYAKYTHRKTQLMSNSKKWLEFGGWTWWNTPVIPAL
jgi:hypothetical protein